ncbi:hypothetical protein J14TS5_41130 [Paenibacillus lautus]|uniref:DUF4209 domain-containing protein n=1 Tax=Paenibacillus lautus TaxID=1401 RepID=UPI001B04372D|nr:DUF4209 domain-containing protein [Paenibacillus lautus]GIO99027.1 hypothetical protein J14TS5_41130 [Paenibacillus lautus]
MANQKIEVQLNRLPLRDFPYNISSVLSQISTEVLQDEDKNILEEMQWISEAANLYTSTPIIEDDYERRFDKYIDQFLEPQIIYYEQELTLTDNAFLKYRYADILLDYQGKFCKSLTLNRYQIYTILLPNLIEFAESYLPDLQHSDIDEPYQSYLCIIARGVEVSLLFRNASFTAKLTELLSRRLSELKKYDTDLRWALETSQLIREIYRSKLIDSEELIQEQICLSLLEEASETFREQNKHLLQRLFLNEMIEWLKLTDPTKKKIKDMQLLVGASFEEEAVEQQGRLEKHKLVEANFLEQALHHYKKIGESEKVKELKVKIRDCYLDSKDLLEENTFSWRIPDESLEQIQQNNALLKKLELEQLLEILKMDDILIPDIDALERQTVSKKKTLSDFLGRSSMIVQGRKVFEETNDEDLYQFKLNQAYSLNLSLVLHYYLFHIFNIAIEKGLTADVFIATFEKWPLLYENNAKIIRTGISRFFEKDYISCLHILVPQLEACVRNLFAQAGYPTTTIKKGNTQHEETFTSFLENPKVIESFGKHYYKYLTFVTVEQTGLNLRNNIAHGLIDSEACNEATCMMVLHLFLSLTRHVLSPQDNE